MGYILEIENLTFGYKRDRLIYRDFSLKLNRGEIVAIVGASGSGKSTLFELISGELKPIKGEIRVSKLSEVFQDPYSSFHHSYSIANQIEDIVNLDRANLFLNRLNLDEKLLYKKPFELSGGELQRCSILRAILSKPDLILADEPTSALDNITALEVMKLLVKLLDEVGILLITHDLDLATWCSDRVIEIGKDSEN